MTESLSLRHDVMKKKAKLLWWVFSEQFKISRVFFVWKFFYSIFDGLSSIALVYFSAQMLSSATKVALASAPTGEFYRWLFYLVFLQIVEKFILTTNSIIDTKLNNIYQTAFNKKIMIKMYELSQSQFESEEFTTAMERAHDGLNSTGRMLTEISWLTSSVVRFFGAFLAIFAVSPLVGIIVILLSIPGILLGLKQNRYSEKVYRDTEPLERITYRTRWLLVDPHSMPEVRLINGFSHLLKQWIKYKTKTDDAYYRMMRRNNLEATFTDLTEPLASTIATVLFFRSLVAGSIALDRFLFLRGLTEQLVNSVNAISNSLQSMDQRFIELENFKVILDLHTDLPNGTIIVDRPLTIEFCDVSFRYPTAEKNTLEGISFVIVPGSKIALVGENGAGKSTLLKLILRQYLPTSGQILVNGVDIADIEQESYYAAISNLSQNFLTVSHLTIKDNLTLGVEDLPKESIEHALELVGASDFVKKLKHKLDSRLDTSFKDGTDLSGGQLQRLGVARALLRDGDIMILDEPTSAIDAKAEFSIFNNIYKEHEGRTTLIVSHRFSTVRKADAIIVMADGKIIEYGSHEELLAFNGLYKEMFELQAEGYK